MKLIKIGILMIILCIVSMGAMAAIVELDLLGPPSGIYLKDPIAALQFKAVASTGVLKNATLWGNFSGNWEANETNFTQLVSGGPAPLQVALSDGYYLWNVYACDSSDACAFNTTLNYTLTIDTIPPVFLINETVDGFVANDSITTHDWIYFNVTTIETNFKNLNYALYNSSGKVNDTTYFTPITGINWTNLPEGDYYYNVTSQDLAGNADGTKTHYLTLDRSVPTITLNSPANLAVDTDGTVSFSYTPSDTYSTISNCSVYAGGSLLATDTSITNGSANGFTISSVTASDSLAWFISCYDNLGHHAVSATQYIDTYANPKGKSSSSFSSVSQTYTAEGGSFQNSLGEGDKVGFTLATMSHSLVVDDIFSVYESGDYVMGVKITISSDPITLEMGANEEKLVDLDSDGIDDIKVEVGEITYNFAEVSLTSLGNTNFEEPAETVDTSKDVETQDESLVDEGRPLWWIWLIVIILVLVAIAVFVKKPETKKALHKKKKK